MLKDVGMDKAAPLLRFLSMLLVTCLVFIVYEAGTFSKSSNAIANNQINKAKIVENSLSSKGEDQGSIKTRSKFKSYDEYVQLQMKKTTNPKLRELWKTRDWERKVKVFKSVFQRLRDAGLLSNKSKALCIAARVGQEVVALREIGVKDSVGIDLVPSGDGLVVKGDMHKHPFGASTFDFEFSNAFDHALYPERFAKEVERTLKGGGVAVLHLAVKTRGDRYSANDIVGGRVDAVARLFKNCEVVHVQDVDGFGLDTELVLRRKSKSM